MGEEEKQEAHKEGEGKEEESPPPEPAPPVEEVAMRVHMHCRGCARKVHRSLKGFQGVEEVRTDCRSHLVVVKGKEVAADPMKVVERLRRKTGRKVELLSPIPPKIEEVADEKKEEVKAIVVEEEKEEPQVTVVVVLKVYMHCEGCSEEIKKRILKMKGVQSVEPDLKASQVTVTGVFEPPDLATHVLRRTGKRAVVVKQDIVAEQPPQDKAAADGKKNKAGEESAEEEKGEGGGSNSDAVVGGDRDAKEGDGGGGQGHGGGGGGEAEEGGGSGGLAVDAAAEAAAAKVAEMRRREQMQRMYYYYNYCYPRYNVEYAHPPQIFSDENPNACTVM